MVSPPHLAEPHLIGMITAFLDESGTHGNSRSTVMAGYFGFEEQWRFLEDRWKKLLGAHPDVKIVHGKELFPRHTPYDKWNDQKLQTFMAEIHSSLRESRVGGIICALTNADYQQYRKKLTGLKATTDSAYGLCFRKCLVTIAGGFSHTGHKVSFIVESGHKNSGDAHRIFHHTKRCAETYRQMSRYALGNFASATKADYGTLQAADLISYLTHKHIEKLLITGDSVVAPSYAAMLNAAACRDFWITGDDLFPLADMAHIVQREYLQFQRARSHHGLR